ncbi:Fe2+-dependent dioxygenase, partial [Phyllobacterium salinisoli]
LQKIRAHLLETSEWQDGRSTAGWKAREVKNNEQLPTEAQGLSALHSTITDALMRDPAFIMAARPKTILPPLFSHYGPGMAYGDHIDDPMIKGVRTDLSLTLFISEPDSYVGGELVIETTSGIEKVKFSAGDALLYPSTSLHRVDPVQSGSRLVAVTWIRSIIRDAGAREILLDLDLARQELFRQHGSSREFDLISKSVANLIRRWGED